MSQVHETTITSSSTAMDKIHKPECCSRCLLLKTSNHNQDAEDAGCAAGSEQPRKDLEER